MSVPSSRNLPRAGAALLLAALLAGPAEAGLCAVDNVPGATLLLPYFEVDYLAQSARRDTLVRIHNATAAPTLMHFTTWSQWAQPIIDVDFFLTGYDVVTFNLEDYFHGNIMITADRGTDFLDQISPHGSFPEWDGNFPTCANFFPFFINPVIRGANLERVQKGLTGKPISSLGNKCLGPDHGDNVGRGYATFDVVSSCSTAFSFDVGYFVDGGAGIATNQNRIFGDWQIVDPGRGIAYGGPLVAIEADAAFTAGSTSTGYTFYGTSGSLGADNREPLGGVYSFRYAAAASAGDPFTATELIVWRDTTAQSFATFGLPCSSTPDWAPLQEGQVLCFDEQENAIELCGGSEACFPLATQKVAFDQGPLAVPFSRGFCQVDLDNPNDAPTGDHDFPSSGPTVQQGHISVLRAGASGIGGALPATVLRHTCVPPPALSGGE